MTNYQAIGSISPEDLALFLYTIYDTDLDPLNITDEYKTLSYNAMKNWLNREFDSMSFYQTVI